jgi:hypothetical protein
MVAALRAKGLPVAYVRSQENNTDFVTPKHQAALDAELYFYSRVFSFSLADPVEPVPIENFPATK